MSDGKPALPGDVPDSEREERHLRGRHAAAYAAARIHAGQRAVLGDMLAPATSQEPALAAAVGQRRMRPSALLPLWRVAGVALGAVTAAMGSRAAAACAAAVDEAMGKPPADEKPPGYRLLGAAIRAGTRAALKASERL